MLIFHHVSWVVTQLIWFVRCDYDLSNVTLNALSAGHRCYRNSKFFLCNLILVFYRLIDLASQLLLLFLMWLLLLLLLLPHLRSLSLSLMHPHTHTLSLSMRITACKIAVIFFSVPACKKYRSSFFRRQLFENVIAETTRMKM